MKWWPILSYNSFISLLHDFVKSFLKILVHCYQQIIIIHMIIDSYRKIIDLPTKT